MNDPKTDAIEKLIEENLCRSDMVPLRARDQLERLKYLAHEHDRHHDTLCAVTSMLLNGAGCWTKELLVEAVRKREAELAAMRGALQRLYHSGEYLIANNHTERCIDGIGDLRDALANVRTSHALTSQAGADLLARMAALEADKRRLDYALSHPFELYWGVHGVAGSHPTTREKIDIVMRDQWDTLPTKEIHKRRDDLNAALARDQKEGK